MSGGTRKMKVSCANCRWFNADEKLCDMDKSGCNADDYCISWEAAIGSGELPEGNSAIAAMKQALWDKAHEHKEVVKVKVDGPKGVTVIEKEVLVPGDIKAMEKYIQLFGG